MIRLRVKPQVGREEWGASGTLREATPYIKHVLAGRIAECDDIHLRAQYAELGDWVCS